MTKIPGFMLCHESLLKNSPLLIKLAADAMKMLWKIDISDCPYTFSRLDERLKAARYNVENNLVDVDDTEPETFGPGGFKNPEELIYWLEAVRVRRI